MSYSEEFLSWWENELRLLQRGRDGFWKAEPTVEVKKRDEKIRPIGTVGELFQRKKVGIMDVEKSAYEDERRILEQRVERLERMLMPFETESFKKLKYGTTFDVGIPPVKVRTETQPSVKREEVKLEELANKVVKGILKGEFVTRGADGTPYQMKNVELMLKKKAKQLGVS